MDQPLDSLTVDWALLRDRLNAPPSTHLPSPAIRTVRSTSVIERAILLCRISYGWTAANIAAMGALYVLHPAPWLVWALAGVIVPTAFEMATLRKIERLLHRSKRELDLPVTVFARAAAQRLSTWRRAADRRSMWLIPWSIAAGLTYGLLEGAADNGALPSFRDLWALLAENPPIWIVLLGTLLAGTWAGTAATRWMHRVTFGEVEKRLRAWSDEATRGSGMSVEG